MCHCLLPEMVENNAEFTKVLSSPEAVQKTSFRMQTRTTATKNKFKEVGNGGITTNGMKGVDITKGTSSK